MSSEPALIDSHCHLHMLEDPAAAVSAARDAGVTHMLTVAVDVASWEPVTALAQRYTEVSASVGVHPCADPAREPSVADMLARASDPAVVAIGETGLDYYYSKGDPERQRERFRRHVAVARELNKPLIVHTRDAREDTVRILRETRASECGGVIHCFTEDYDTAARCIDLGFYISFSGILTFRNADSLRDVARRVPLERILIETDSPYLAPVPYRGKKNQPAYVRRVAEQLAELKDVSVQEVARITTDNFHRLFPLAAAA